MTEYRNSIPHVAHNFPSTGLRGDTIEELERIVDRVYTPQPPTQPTIINSTAPPLKFDAAFLDRRMAEHREWQERTLLDLTSDAVDEVVAAFAYVKRVRENAPTRIARLK